MNDLVLFARSLGIIITSPPPLGVWKRYPTQDHPNKKNGAIKWMGDHAFIQNWATDLEPMVWKTDKPVDMARIQRDAAEAERIKKLKQAEAAKKAGWIMHQCQLGRHEYLKNKGFPDEQGNIWLKDGQQILVIPMRIGGRIVGCQLIGETGEKKFLTGQRTSDATYTIDNKGLNILCEGYATALSIKRAMVALKRRYTLHVCFSAGNMLKVAKHLPRGLVVADNDESLTGERTAKEIGWPYFLPPEVGQDFNDFEKSSGLFRASQALGKAIAASQKICID